MTGTSNNYTGLSGGVQAETWRDASHSQFYARQFRVFPGFLGLKSFLNFFKKKVLGPLFTPQSSFKGAQRAALVSPRTFCISNFLKIFSFCTTSRQPGIRTVSQAENQIARQSAHPSSHLEKITRPLSHSQPTPSKAKTSADNKTQRQRKSPEANLGASVERLTRLELATSTLARWCSTN